SLGFLCDYFPDLDLDTFLKILPSYHGIIIRSRFKITKEIMDVASSLKFIARVGSGLESIDVDYAHKKGIACLNSPEGNRDAVGEQAIGMLLALLNNLARADRQVRQGIWIREGNRGTEIKGKTIGIIGYGNMGSSFAKKLKGFEARIIAYDKYKSGFGNEYVEEVSLEEIFAHAQILSLHVPLTEETHYMINEDFISKFSYPFVLINTSRGKVVQTEALVEALENGKILGAALDVLEYESISFEKIEKSHTPDPLRYLLKSDQVILSPHIAGWTFESHIKLSKVLVEKIKQIDW
ncbi:MAG: hydroxyacid dehydrogenase, partial [Bacteroidales bacterium]|nr:hydroxyacid dehydrogenase [Bacteroidales bacterium]